MPKTNYTVKDAIAFLSQFPEDANVGGFGQVKVTPKPVAVKPAKATEPK